jgi:hypothetical protein
MSEKLKLAKQQMGSAGRESAEMQRKRERIVRKYSGIDGDKVRVVPNPEMDTPSKETMMRDSMSSVINFEEPKKRKK